MVDARVEKLESELRWRLRHFLTDDARAKSGRRWMLKRIQNSAWPAVLFGGTLRDIMVNGAWTHLRDVDIVFGDTTSDQLLAQFEPFVRRRTRFGGLNLLVEGHAFDVWSLRDTWAFREFPVLLKGDFADLPYTTFLTVEAVAVELHADSGQPRMIFHHRFFESLLDRVVELNFAENPYPELAVIRSFVTAQKLGFSIGPSLARYITHFGRRSSPEQLFGAQVSHYHHALFSVSEIAQLVNLVARHVKWSPRQPVPIPSPRQLFLF